MGVRSRRGQTMTGKNALSQGSARGRMSFRVSPSGIGTEIKGDSPSRPIQDAVAMWHRLCSPKSAYADRSRLSIRSPA